MAKKRDDHTATVLEELYQIDPGLRQFEGDLPRLISILETNHPEVTVNQTFVRELRTSLLSYKPAATVARTSTTTPLFWWLTRLTPIGISLVLLFVLVPDLTKTPTEPHQLDLSEPEAFETTPSQLDETTDEMRMDTIMLESAREEGEESSDETAQFSMEAAPTSLQVTPPPSGNTLTIISLVMPDDGWIVVYKDQEGELGEMLHSSFLIKGEYQKLPLLLSDDVLYPELVTVVVYAGTQPNQFDAALEAVQIDPRNDSPMMVTVPVVNELEPEMME